MNTPLKVSENKPESFSDSIPVAACYLECEGKILLLKRSSIESEPESWGVPGGCIEANEDPLDGAHRELAEETGIRLPPSFPLQPLGPVYLQKRGWNLVYHIFTVKIPRPLPISLSDEHTDYLWASPEDIVPLKMIEGFTEAFELFRKRSKNFTL